LPSPECRCRVEGYRSLAAYRFPRIHVVPLSLGQAFTLSGSRGVALSLPLALSLSRSPACLTRPAPSVAANLLTLALSPVSLSRLSRSRPGLASRSGVIFSRIFGSRQRLFSCPARTVPLSEYLKLEWVSCLCFGWRFENFELYLVYLNRCSVIVSP